MYTYLLFEGKLLRYAYKKTYKFLHWNKLAIVPIFGFFFGCIFHAIYFGWKAAKEELIIFLFYGVAGTVIVLAMLFIGCLCVAPYQIWKKEKKLRETLDVELRERIKVLEEEKRPKLEIMFKEGEPPWHQLQEDGAGNTFSTFRASIKNAGFEKISNIQVKLIRLDPHPKNCFMIPCPLVFIHDRPPYPKSKDLQQTKSETDALFVDILTYLKGGNFEEINLSHGISDLESRIPTQPYTIEIAISSDNGGETINKNFHFDPSRDVANALRMLED